MRNEMKLGTMREETLDIMDALNNGSLVLDSTKGLRHFADQVTDLGCEYEPAGYPV